MSGGDPDDERRAALAINDDAVEALRRATLFIREMQRELNALKARHGVLIDILTANGTLQPGHLTLMDREATDARAALPRIQLRVVPDPPPPPAVIDCEARLPLCRARCCTLQVTLTEAEVNDGLAFEVQEPYMMRREVDGYCTYIDRAGARCGIYDRRPYDCRRYDCREDPRIWVDFAQRIPAEAPAGVRLLVLQPRR
jgi:Fe-S-cluster containining protein